MKNADAMQAVIDEFEEMQREERKSEKAEKKKKKKQKQSEEVKDDLVNCCIILREYIDICQRSYVNLTSDNKAHNSKWHQVPRFLLWVHFQSVC